MCRAFADMRRIRRRGSACAALVLASSLGLRAAGGETLFLLTGTSMADTSQTFPARLYTASAAGKLSLFREVVPGTEGITEVLDDTEDKIYVAFPSNTGISRAPTKLGVIDKRAPAVGGVLTFNPTVMLVYPQAMATAAGQGLNSYALFTLFPEPPPTLNGHSAFMRFIQSDATTLVAIAGNEPTKGPRVTRNEWGLYSHLTFYGSPGGPGEYFTPQALAEGGDLVMHLGGKVIVVDQSPPPLRPAANGHGIRIVAVNRRFVVTWFFPASDRSAPAVFYVHDRQLGKWRDLKFQWSIPQSRIFGPWLATIAATYEGAEGVWRDPNPGHSDEGNYWVKDVLPDVRLEFGDMRMYWVIPGMLVLDNLGDGRRITLQTNEEDSEILDVRKDGLVLYRINDSIFSARIEGDKLSAPTLVVKDDDVPEVHWAFWSNAEVKTETKPKAAPPAPPAAGR